MSSQESEIYYRFSEELTDKISYGFQHPENIGIVKSIRTKAQEKGFDVKTLQALLKNQVLRNESIEPFKHPNHLFRYLGLEDVESNTGRIREYQQVNGEEILSKSMLFYQGDILFARLRPYLNKVHLVQVENLNVEGEKLPDLQTIGSGEFYVINPDTHQILPEFLCKYLLSDLTLTQTKWILSGNSYPRLDEDQFLNLLVIVPSISDQTKILEELSILEREINPINEEIKAARSKNNSLMLKELGFPEMTDGEDYFFRNGNYKNSQYHALFPEHIGDRLSYNYNLQKFSSIDELKHKYSTTTISEIVSENIRRGEQPKYCEDGEIIAIKTVDLRDGFIDYANCLRVSREFYDKKQILKAHVKKHDVLVSSTGYVSMGKIDLYDSESEAMCDGHISILRLKDGFEPFYVVYYLRSIFGKMQIEKYWTGSSGQIELQPTDIGKFIIPDNCERGITLIQQEKIAKLIRDQLNKLTELESKESRLLDDGRREFLRKIGFTPSTER